MKGCSHPVNLECKFALEKMILGWVACVPIGMLRSPFKMVEGTLIQSVGVQGMREVQEIHSN